MRAFRVADLHGVGRQQGHHLRAVLDRLGGQPLVHGGHWHQLVLFGGQSTGSLFVWKLMFLS